MLIEVKYAIGDHVRFKNSATIVEKEDCEFCGTIGTITGLDGTVEDCPRCDGKGYTEKEISSELEYDAVINDIKVYYCGRNDRVQNPYVLYRMSGWSWGQTWIGEDQILEVIDNVN